MGGSVEPALASALAGFGVLLLAAGAWLQAQATVSATILLVAQARGDGPGAHLRQRRPVDAVRRAAGRLAAALGPLAGPLGSRAVKDRLAWLGTGETVEQFLARQILLAGAGLMVGDALPVLYGEGAAGTLLAPLGAALGWWLPWQDLEARCRSIRRRLGREALSWAEFLTAAVQAGLPLEEAIARLGRELPGRLPQFLARAVRESYLTREPLDLCLAATAAQ